MKTDRSPFLSPLSCPVGLGEKPGKRDSVLPAVMLYAEIFIEDWDEPKIPAWYNEMRDLLAEINNEEPK